MSHVHWMQEEEDDDDCVIIQVDARVSKARERYKKLKVDEVCGSISDCTCM